MATAMHQPLDAPMTTPALARAAGVDEWMLRAAVRRGFNAAPAKVGPLHLWHAGDLPRVVAGLRQAGYLPPDAAADSA